MSARGEEFASHSPDETRAAGRALGATLHGGELVLLTGSIGAGKSVFARGIGDALAVSGWRGSPSFTLVNEYPTVPALYHIDLYRLAPAEVVELGVEQYLRPDSVVVVEWADRAAAYLQRVAESPATWVNLILTGPSERLIELCRPEGHGG